jgi:serine/threonine-protein kinase
MSQSQGIAEKAPASGSQTMTEMAAQPSAKASRRFCPLAMFASKGVGFTQEIGCLLRSRLRLAALIFGAALTIFFLRKVLDPSGLYAHPLNIALQGATAAVAVGLAALLFSRVSLSVGQLRAVELVLFGVVALYFSWLQLSGQGRYQILEWAKEEYRENVLQVANAANNLRWFALIVIYGTFVPNTWRRCALVVGLLALTPLALTTYMLLGCPYLGACLGQSIFDTGILVGIASFIGIFGSYKISALQHEAFEARQLGQYRLKQRLGAGGMGEVYLGEHVLLRRACAIKLIRPEQAGDGTALQRFEREVQAMATLTHWNTVEVFDYGRDDDGTFYYVMEHLPGLSLQEMVSRHGPLPPARAVHFVRQVCAALGEAHGRGIIHRDIKPSNVIACERGGVPDVAKLLDFGLAQCMGVAKVDSKLTVQGTILGSPPFMSPEQAQGKEHLDARTDIYSLGAVAYFLVTGQAPFVRDTAMQMLMAHVYEKVLPPSEVRPEVPGDLEAVLLRCLEKDPGRRFQSAEELDEALDGCDCSGQWGRRDAASWWQATPTGAEAPSPTGNGQAVGTAAAQERLQTPLEA